MGGDIAAVKADAINVAIGSRLRANLELNRDTRREER